MNAPAGQHVMKKSELLDLLKQVDDNAYVVLVSEKSGVRYFINRIKRKDGMTAEIEFV